jgi:hypothetical protein
MKIDFPPTVQLRSPPVEKGFPQLKIKSENRFSTDGSVKISTSRNRISSVNLFKTITRGNGCSKNINHVLKIGINILILGTFH